MKPDHILLVEGVERGLPSGRFLRLRFGTADDEFLLHELGESFSIHTLSEVLYQTARVPTVERLERYLQTEFPERVTIFAWSESEQTLGRERKPRYVGLAHYWKTDPQTAIMTLVVGDPWRGRGIGKVLFEELVTVAKEAGVKKLQTYFSSDDVSMLRLLERSGLRMEKPPNDQSPWEIHVGTDSNSENEQTTRMLSERKGIR